MKTTKLLCSSLFLLFVFTVFGGTVFGQTTLVEYTFTGDSPTASTLEAGLSATNFDISSGSVGYASFQDETWTGSGVPHTNNSGSWDEELADDGKYYSFTLETDGADSFDLTNISFLYRSTGSGPESITIRINGTDVTTITSANSNSTEAVSESLDLTELTSAEVRIIGWNGGGGAFRLDDIKLAGDVEISTPILAASETDLDFEYVESSGPADAQSFELTGSNLDGSDVSVTAPSNFEVSKTEGGTYSSSVTYTSYDGSAENVWVRLESGLAVNDYSGDVTISGGGASNVTLAVAGEVLEEKFLIYDFTEEEVTPRQSPANSTTSNFQITSGSISFGSVAENDWTGSGVPYAQGSSWDEVTAENAKNFFFTVEPENGYGLTLTNISFSYYATGSGPSDISVEINGQEVGSVTGLTDGQVNLFDESLSGFEELNSVEVRIKGYNGGGGDFRVDDVFIDGSVVEDIYFVEITGSEGWRILSSPTSDNTYDDLLGDLWTQGMTGSDSPSNGTANVKTHDGEGSSYEAVSDLGNTMTAGNGFITYVYADDDYDGDDETFPKTLSLSGTENTGTVTPTLTSGANAWTLVGNPYASTIDWDDLGKTHLMETVYVYDHSYGTIDGGGDDASASVGGGYRTWNGSEAGSLTDGLIAPFQGFWVQNSASATSEELSIEEADKTTGATFYKNVNESVTIQLRGEMANMYSETFLSFTETGLLDKDNYDGLKLSPLDFKDYLSVATLTGATKLDINNLPADFENEINIPVSVQGFTADAEQGSWIPKGGEVTLSWPVMENLPQDWTVTLTDFETGTSVDMKTATEYMFSMDGESSQAKEAPSTTILRPQPPQAERMAKDVEAPRFTVTITRTKATSNEPGDTPEGFTLEQNYPNPFNPTTSIQYSVGQAGPVSLSVYNVMGQKVAELVRETKTAGTYRVHWDAANMASGIYHYRLQSAGQVLTRQMTLIK